MRTNIGFPCFSPTINVWLNWGYLNTPWIRRANGFCNDKLLLARKLQISCEIWNLCAFFRANLRSYSVDLKSRIYLVKMSRAVEPHGDHLIKLKWCDRHKSLVWRLPQKEQQEYHFTTKRTLTAIHVLHHDHHFFGDFCFCVCSVDFFCESMLPNTNDLIHISDATIFCIDLCLLWE